MITDDDLDDLELQRRPKGVPEAEWLRARVTTILDWIDAPDVELRGVTTSHLMSVAAEHLSTIGDLDAALALAARATTSDDEGALGSIPVLIEVLLARGEVSEAEEAAQQLRTALRADPYVVHPSTIERIGEEFAYHGHLGIAERWFTLGVRIAEQTDASDIVLARAMTFRAAARRRAGKSPDGLDLEAQEYADEIGWTDRDPLVYKEDEEG